MTTYKHLLLLMTTILAISAAFLALNDGLNLLLADNYLPAALAAGVALCYFLAPVFLWTKLKKELFYLYSGIFFLLTALLLVTHFSLFFLAGFVFLDGVWLLQSDQTIQLWLGFILLVVSAGLAMAQHSFTLFK